MRARISKYFSYEWGTNNDVIVTVIAESVERVTTRHFEGNLAPVLDSICRMNSAEFYKLNVVDLKARSLSNFSSPNNIYLILFCNLEWNWDAFRNKSLYGVSTPVRPETLDWNNLHILFDLSTEKIVKRILTGLHY